MRAKLPLRVSSIILFLFALGHTVGFQTFRPASQQGLAVMEAMRNVPFAFGNATVHWMDLYMGFGLALSVSGFFSETVAWRLSAATVAEMSLVRAITLLLCATPGCRLCSQHPLFRNCPGRILAGIYCRPGLERSPADCDEQDYVLDARRPQ